MTGRGQGMPAAVQLELAASLTRHPGLAAQAVDDAGEHGEEAASTGRASCPGASETRTLPWVSTPIAASTWLGSSVLAVHAEPLATAKPSRSSSVTSASPST